MGKTKRMIYIRPDNIEFYDALENKSDFINDALELARLGGVKSLSAKDMGEVTEEDMNQADRNIGIHQEIQNMRERDAKRLKEYRQKHGLYDPTKS